MTPTSTKPEPEVLERSGLEQMLADEAAARAAREKRIIRLRLLWAQRKFLARVVLYGLVASTALAFLIPKRYESTARLMPPDNQAASNLSLLAGLSARAGTGIGSIAGDLLGLKTSGALFVGVLRSRTVEDRLIERFDLKRVYWVWRTADAREKLEDRTSISEDRKSGIITITVTDGDPKRAAAMAQAYVEELNRHMAELTTSGAHRERVFIEERLKAVKQELDQAAQDFSQFASKNTAIDIKEQGRAMVEAAAILQGQMIAAQTELEGLKQVYTDNNVRVRATQARIAELKRQLEKLGGKDVGAATPAKQEANASEAQADSGEALYPSIRKLPLLGVKYADLYRRTKIQETVFELLTQQYELAKVQEAKEIPSVKVLDAADVPEKKSFPPRMLIVFLGSMLSLAGGVAWVLGSAQWEKADPQAPGKVLATEVFTQLQADARSLSRNGGGASGLASKVFGRFWRTGVKPEERP